MTLIKRLNLTFMRTLAVAAAAALLAIALLPAAAAPAGQRHCRVPRLAGLTVREARPKLEAAGCRLGARHPKHLGPKAVVIATSPQTGAVLPLHARVSVFLRLR